MYGEKAEETEELKLDIQDLKAMYRQQVRHGDEASFRGNGSRLGLVQRERKSIRPRSEGTEVDEASFRGNGSR